MDQIIMAWLTWLLIAVGGMLAVIGAAVYFGLRRKTRADRERAEEESARADEPLAEETTDEFAIEGASGLGTTLGEDTGSSKQVGEYPHEQYPQHDFEQLDYQPEEHEGERQPDAHENERQPESKALDPEEYESRDVMGSEKTSS